MNYIAWQEKAIRCVRQGLFRREDGGGVDI